MFVFGGCGRSPDDMEETYFNDLYILDTSMVVFQYFSPVLRCGLKVGPVTSSTAKKKLILTTR